jgi:hypothetical protein
MEELRESSGSRGFGRRRENGGGDGGDRCKLFAGKKFLREGMARFCRDRCGWSKGGLNGNYRGRRGLSPTLPGAAYATARNFVF